jgi:hypothetical protein
MMVNNMNKIIRIDEDELRGLLKEITIKSRHQTGGCNNCTHYNNNVRAKCQWCNRTFNHTNKLKKIDIGKFIAKVQNDSAERTKLASKKYSTLEEIAKPYIDMGLAEPFAFALAEKPALKKDIMALWESKWWKQYEATDILICSVLDGTITEDEGKWLNSVRSDHDDLAIACIKGKCTIEWAEALLNSGFNGQAKAVTACLAGGMPDVIAQIGGFDVNESIIPPPIKEVKLKKKKNQSKNGDSENLSHLGLKTSRHWKEYAGKINLTGRSGMRIEILIENIKKAHKVFETHFIEEELLIPITKNEQMDLLNKAGLNCSKSWSLKFREDMIRQTVVAFQIDATDIYV